MRRGATGRTVQAYLDELAVHDGIESATVEVWSGDGSAVVDTWVWRNRGRGRPRVPRTSATKLAALDGKTQGVLVKVVLRSRLLELEGQEAG
jgi:hypothetical protein